MIDVTSKTQCMEEERINRLYKSTNDRIFTGVAAGLADFFDTNPYVIRALFILLTLANGIGVVFYVMLSLVLPTEDKIMEEEDIAFFESAIKGEQGKLEQERQQALADATLVDDLVTRENILAFVLMLVGVAVLEYNVVPWALVPQQAQIPVLIITAGLGLVIKSTNSVKN